MKEVMDVISYIMITLCVCLSMICFYDNSVTRRKAENMSTAISLVLKNQKVNDAIIRQVQTDTEIMLRLTAGGDFIQEE